MPTLEVCRARASRNGRRSSSARRSIVDCRRWVSLRSTHPTVLGAAARLRGRLGRGIDVAARRAPAASLRCRHRGSEFGQHVALGGKPMTIGFAVAAAVRRPTGDTHAHESARSRSCGMRASRSAPLGCRRFANLSARIQARVRIVDRARNKREGLSAASSAFANTESRAARDAQPFHAALRAPPGGQPVGKTRMARAIGEACDRVAAAEAEVGLAGIAERPAAAAAGKVDQ